VKISVQAKLGYIFKKTEGNIKAQAPNNKTMR
jgi:hypothetical protein